MHALLLLAAVLSSQPSDPEASQPSDPEEFDELPEEEEPRVLFHPMLMLGVGIGGDTLSTFTHPDGSTSELKAGGILQAGASLVVDFTTVPLQLQATASYLGNNMYAANAKVFFNRFPMEVLGFFKIGTVRLGGGLQYALWPKVDLKSSEKNASMWFHDALGFVIEGGYLECNLIGLGTKLCLGGNLRFARQSYNTVSAMLNGEAVPPDKEKVNGNQIGGNILFGF